ncbi:hypothetical protein TSUD_358610 [Trifolium subterraneum]|uniref:G protein gamma domain-containing protein n=1 Tax=Trifolium subterraneum TaxID=3900 RepID=A0A2Z6MKF0_TRISU|nr:hypothetical protein TSUD_358610 [Trifolium subterraneum]
MDDGEYNFSSMSLTSKPSMEKLMSPKSPLPGFVDFHGKRKQMVKIQVLEREIGLLQEELTSLEGLQPASRCCKEVNSLLHILFGYVWIHLLRWTILIVFHGYVAPAVAFFIRKLQNVVVVHAVHHQTPNVLVAAA